MNAFRIDMPFFVGRIRPGRPAEPPDGLFQDHYRVDPDFLPRMLEAGEFIIRDMTPRLLPIDEEDILIVDEVAEAIDTVNLFEDRDWMVIGNPSRSSGIGPDGTLQTKGVVPNEIEDDRDDEEEPFE